MLTQWSRTEILLTTGKEYTNPFLDVSLNAVFEHESGEKIYLPGFWKGDHTWCVRFAPTKPGKWTYRTSADDGNPDLRASGTLEAGPAAGETELSRRGFVRIQGRGFVYDDGTPFFWLGDTHWQAPDLERLDECNEPGCTCGNQFAHMVEKRLKQGYTVYQTYPSPSDNEGNGKRRTWWTVPYKQIDPDTFNLIFDKKMDYLAQRGMTIVLGIGVHSASTSAMGDDLIPFARYMVARYASYPIIWILGQEIDMEYGREGTDGYRVWMRAAETIALTDGYHHPLGTHLLAREYGAAGPDMDLRPWHQFWAVQAGHWNTTNQGEMRPLKFYRDYYDTGKPVVETEAFYEDLRRGFGQDLFFRNNNGYETWRNAAWKACQCGSAGFTYGVHGIWGMRWSTNPADGGWSKSYNREPWYMGLDKVGGDEMRFLRRFYEALDFENLKPVFGDESLCGFSDREHAVVSAIDRETLVVYLYGPEVTGFLKGLSGRYHALWYDPRTGKALQLGTMEGPEIALPPRPTPKDWVLLLTKGALPVFGEDDLPEDHLLPQPVGTPADYTAVSVFSEKPYRKGEIWYPFCPTCGNVLHIDLGSEQALAAFELCTEEDPSGEYRYRLDGVRGEDVTVLCDRVTAPVSEPHTVESIHGTFRYLRLNLISGWKPDGTIPGLIKLAFYRK